eukprot:2593101-Pyramimonas_sp.AAC.1
MRTQDPSSRLAGVASSSQEGSAQGEVVQLAVELAARQAWLAPPRGAPSPSSRLAARGGARGGSHRTLP